MQKSFTTILQESKEDIKGFLQSKRELWTLTALERGVPVGVSVVYRVILAILALFLLSFLLTAGAFAFSLIFVGEDFFIILKSITLGFLCLSGILLLLILLLMALQRKLTLRLSESIIGKYLDKTEETTPQQAPTLADHVEPLDTDIVEVQGEDTIKPISYYEEK